MEQFKPPERRRKPLRKLVRWKQRFELYLEASGVTGKEKKTKAATLLHVVSAEALQVYNTFTWDNIRESTTDHG